MRWGWYRQTCLSPPVIFLLIVPTWRWLFFCGSIKVCYLFFVSYCLVCSLQSRGHLLGKDWPLGSLVCDVFSLFVTFSYGVLGQVWYLIVWIPDLCLIPTLINIGLIYRALFPTLTSFLNTNLYNLSYGRLGLVRPRIMVGIWLHFACRLRYGAWKHIWTSLVTTLFTWVYNGCIFEGCIGFVT